MESRITSNRRFSNISGAAYFHFLLQYFIVSHRQKELYVLWKPSFCALLSFCQPFRKEAVADKEAFWGLADQLLVHKSLQGSLYAAGGR